MNARSILYCGTKSLDLELFNPLIREFDLYLKANRSLLLSKSGPTMMDTFEMRLTRARLDIQSELLMRKRQKPDGLRVDRLWLLSMLSSTVCYDRRDVIFSLMVLQEALGSEVLKIDYTVSAEEVYIATAIKLIQEMGNYHLLLYDRQATTWADLPSWGARLRKRFPSANLHGL